MLCEQELCVYQSDGECKLQNIRIDSLGQCAECLYPDINSAYLKKIKKDFIEKQLSR